MTPPQPAPAPQDRAQTALQLIADTLSAIAPHLTGTPAWWDDAGAPGHLNDAGAHLERAARELRTALERLQRGVTQDATGDPPIQHSLYRQMYARDRGAWEPFSVKRDAPGGQA